MKNEELTSGSTFFIRNSKFFIPFLLFLVVLLFSMPASTWEFDETLFFRGLHQYDPVAHHPPPPGYPLFMGAGKVVRAFMPNDFSALVLLSVLSSAIAFVMLALALRNLSGDATMGIGGAALFYFSPAMLVHASLPISEPGALALLATALYFGSKRSPALFALFAALTVGWRIQFSIFVVPLFLITVAMWSAGGLAGERRGKNAGGAAGAPLRDGLIALLTFTLVCILWLIPLAIAVGGFEELVAFEMGQGKYLATHDADQSRSGWTPPMIALRFIAHPWGVKLASFPLLVVALAGAVVTLRARRTITVPLALAGAGYLAFALWTMDPADGVRYAIPVVLTTALFAGIGIVTIARRIAIPPFVLVAIFAAGSLVYVSSLLTQRRSSPSPPVQAIAFAKSQYRKGAVATYELPLWPHATYFLGDYSPQRFDDAMAKLYEREGVPMFLLADGASLAPGAKTFSWAPSDAYSKLTRNHYRVASIIPLPPETRFRVIKGVYGWEREAEGLAWRWLAGEAELQLPNAPARTLHIDLGLPPDSAIESNDIAILVDGAPAGIWRVDRGARTTISIVIPSGAPIIRFVPKTEFVPAQISGSLSRDPRTLSVKLLTLRAVPRRSIDVPAARPAASQQPERAEAGRR